jgi:putative phosphonate catabolism associated alcohol dehydrogenase
MTRTGMAATFVGPNQPFVMKEYPVVPPGPDQVLVQVTMGTICRSDVSSWEGKRYNPTPSILGHEIIGVIEALGDGVGPDLQGQALRVGDRITWTEFFYCGKCLYCSVLDTPQKCLNIQKYGHLPSDQEPHFLGGFADYCYVLPHTDIVRIPNNLSDQEATPIMCGVPTMVSVIESVSVGIDDTVVIQGLGLLGLYGIALARDKKARTVIAIDSVKARLDMAETFGADQVFDASKMSADDLVAAVRDACPPDGADVVIEVCGDPAVIPQGIDMLRAGGRYAITGTVSPNATVKLDANRILSRMVTLTGVHNYHPKHLVEALNFVNQNQSKYPLKQLVDAQYSLQNLDIAFNDMSERQVMRAAIVPDK